MLTLQKFCISKDQLLALSPTHRNTILGGGKILNELNITTKYLLFCDNAIKAAGEEAKHLAALTTLMFFTRILAGHVLEGYNFYKSIRLDEFSNKCGQLDEAFYALKKQLDQYFGRKNLIFSMRQRFSFHTDKDTLNTTLEQIDPTFMYELFAGEVPGEHVFFGSELIMIDGVRHLLSQGGDWQISIKAAQLEANEMALHLCEVIQRLIGCVLMDHLGVAATDATLVKLPEGPNFEDILIPYFISAREESI